ncbi:tetratricopeptide repeat protein [Erythrobacter litoralis]|uniref:Cytochrome c biogenesis factor n=1 Tax=Erythrobacter litoralis (strain HTCC2594) TaxID=314225 RepID=Q2NBS2_ERYLH|nr:tetratricopeptide repeat protein [Erythrobacter litoralis]ABC62869.1 cytochrome c biogenesis factor [Erythrobacter litoralis HTCC2594]
MSTWIAIAAMALTAFGLGAWLLREQRGVWTLMAAMLVVGLAGYAWQGSPGYGSVSAESLEEPRGNPGLIDARREFFDPANPPSRYVTTADAFARRGDYERAANFLRGAVSENPNDGEAWLALGVALVEHARGNEAPAAEMAFKQARARLPGNPGPAFFQGVNAMRAGEFTQARELWIEALAESDENAPGREYVAERLVGLDRLMETLMQQMQGDPRTTPPGTPAMPPAASSTPPAPGTGGP